eukprot:934031-Prymnesium_polylepis.1
MPSARPRGFAPYWGVARPARHSSMRQFQRGELGVSRASPIPPQLAARLSPFVCTTSREQFPSNMVPDFPSDGPPVGVEPAFVGHHSTLLPTGLPTVAPWRYSSPPHRRN